MDPSSAFFPGQLRVSPSQEDVWLLWVAKLALGLAWAPASVRDVLAESPRSGLVHRWNVPVAGIRVPAAKQRSSEPSLRTRLAAAPGWGAALSFSLGRDEGTLSPAMRIRHVAKPCQWVMVQRWKCGAGQWLCASSCSALCREMCFIVPWGRGKLLQLAKYLQLLWLSTRLIFQLLKQSKRLKGKNTLSLFELTFYSSEKKSCWFFFQINQNILRENCRWLLDLALLLIRNRHHLRRRLAGTVFAPCQHRPTRQDYLNLKYTSSKVSSELSILYTQSLHRLFLSSSIANPCFYF